MCWIWKCMASSGKLLEIMPQLLAPLCQWKAGFFLADFGPLQVYLNLFFAKKNIYWGQNPPPFQKFYNQPIAKRLSLSIPSGFRTLQYTANKPFLLFTSRSTPPYSQFQTFSHVGPPLQRICHNCQRHWNSYSFPWGSNLYSGESSMGWLLARAYTPLDGKPVCVFSIKKITFWLIVRTY